MKKDKNLPLLLLTPEEMEYVMEIPAGRKTHTCSCGHLWVFHLPADFVAAHCPIPGCDCKQEEP